MRTDDDIISDIEEMRRRNNINWMDLLRLAMRLSPDETKKILGRIKRDDKRIDTLVGELIEPKFGGE